jgi:hypothetical protein
MSIERTHESLPAEHAPAGRAPRRSNWKLYLLVLVCVAPVVASYLAYYVFPPSERTNYGVLIDPQRPVPALDSTPVRMAEVDPAQADLAEAVARDGLGAFKGRWILLTVASGACDHDCAEKLFFVRQTHAALGKDRDRVQQVLLVTAAPLPPPVIEAHPALVVLRVAPEELAPLLPVAEGTTHADHIYLVDPLHNLMMRFPPNPDPARTRKDLQKLLKASRIG